MSTKPLLAWQRNLIRCMEQSGESVFTERRLRTFLVERTAGLEGPPTLSFDRMRKFLMRHAQLREQQMLPDSGAKRSGGESYRMKSRYLWGTPSAYRVALSLRSNSYLTHASAVHLWGFLHEIPKTIYVNQEQGPKPRTNRLSQEGINRAFKNEPRLSKYAYIHDGHRILLLSGKHTARLGVIELIHTNGESYPTTTIERTLIDCVVRASYAGGVEMTQKLFRNARERVSTTELVSMLRKLDYTYPYHQAIGFLMERGGYREDQVAPLRAIGMSYDFYLSNKMKSPRYDPSWKLYYPSNFEAKYG